MIENDGVRCEPVTRCGLCGAAGEIRFKELSDHLFGAPGRWSIRQCVNAACGTGWIDPKPILNDIGKLYASYYTHDSEAESAVSSDMTGPANHIAIKKLLRVLMPWQSEQFASRLLYLERLKPGRLLEVGCGAGNFLAAARQSGWEVEGIDFDANAVAAANAHDGVTARVGDIDDQSLQEGSYDALVMNHVIEHVPDPAHVFARCAALLRPGGRLVMVTPNMKAQGLRIFGPDWRGLEIPRHLFLFTAKSLQKLARDCGLKHVQAFSPIGGHETQFIIDLSREIAKRAGRKPPAADAKRMRASAALKSIFGMARGEFLVLVAER